MGLSRRTFTREFKLQAVRRLEMGGAARATELDSAWAASPLAVTEHLGQTAIVLEDPGGKPLDRILSGPVELSTCLRIAVGLATTLNGLHKGDSFTRT